VLGTVGDPGGAPLRPRVSPDGRRVVVDRVVQGNVDVWLLDGTRMSRVTFDAAIDFFPIWSPDGTRIVFTRRTDHAEIYVMRADGSKQEMLPGLPGDAVNDCCARWRP
jgi:Tol biopolymer transport system component